MRSSYTGDPRVWVGNVCTIDGWENPVGRPCEYTGSCCEVPGYADEVGASRLGCWETIEASEACA